MSEHEYKAALQLIDAAFRLAERSTPPTLRRAILDARRLIERRPPTPDRPTVRHTSCRHCGLDIEGFAPFNRATWRDRGNNTHCASGAVHAPVREL